jgi:hypothetical protein
MGTKAAGGDTQCAKKDSADTTSPIKSILYVGAATCRPFPQIGNMRVEIWQLGVAQLLCVPCTFEVAAGEIYSFGR